MTHTPAVAPNLDTLPAEELLGELRAVTREQAEAEARRDRLAADLARRTEEQEQVVATTQQRWGSRVVVAPSGDPERECLRAELAAAEEYLPAIDMRREETLAALRRRVAREETAIAQERAAIERDAAALAARHERLRELWQPLAAFEGVPAGDPPTAGATHQAAVALRSRRDQLWQRERTLARLRAAVADE